tara:strand:- start:2176 stop:2574 length:399 start_codon:yes stop_codon:yes gene_type:complete
MRKLAELQDRVARLERRATNKVYPVYEVDVNFPFHILTIKLIPLPKVLEAMTQDRRLDEDQVIEYMTLRKKHSVEFVAEMFVMLAGSQVSVSLPVVEEDSNSVVIDMSDWPENESFDRWFKEWTDTYLITVH